MVDERCTVQKISLLDVERSVTDPALAGLLADGWTVIASMHAEDGAGPHLVLVMAPPREASEPPRAVRARALAVVALSLPMWVAIVLGLLGLLG